MRLERGVHDAQANGVANGVREPFGVWPRPAVDRESQHIAELQDPTRMWCSVPEIDHEHAVPRRGAGPRDRKSTRLNSSHVEISYAVFCLKKKQSRRSEVLRQR